MMSLEDMVKRIDKVNGKYIMQCPEIRSTYGIILDYIERGRLEMADLCTSHLKEQIRILPMYSLLPSNLKVGEGVTVHFWSDQYAATIVKVTRETVIVRKDAMIFAPDYAPDIIVREGTVYCANQDNPKCMYEPDRGGAEYRFRWSRKHCRFGQPGDLYISKGRPGYENNKFKKEEVVWMKLS